MKRGFIWFLVFAAVFFMGMNAAGGKGSTDSVTQDTVQDAVVIPEQSSGYAEVPILPETEMQAATEPVFHPVTEVTEVPEQTGGLLTNKTASLLERAVSGMYEIIVGFLYNIASLLF